MKERTLVKRDLAKLLSHIPRPLPSLQSEGLFEDIESRVLQNIDRSNYDNLREIWNNAESYKIDTLTDRESSIDAILYASVFVAEYILNYIFGGKRLFIMQFCDPIHRILETFTKPYSPGYKEPPHTSKKDLHLADLILSKVSQILQNMEFEDKCHFLGKIFLARAAYCFYHYCPNNNYKSLLRDQSASSLRVYQGIVNIIQHFTNSNLWFSQLYSLLDNSAVQKISKNLGNNKCGCDKRNKHRNKQRLEYLLYEASRYICNMAPSIDVLRLFMCKLRTCQLEKGYVCDYIPVSRSYIFVKVIVRASCYRIGLPPSTFAYVDHLTELNCMSSGVLHSLSHDVPSSFYENLRYLNAIEWQLSVVDRWIVHLSRLLVDGIDVRVLPEEIQHKLAIGELKRMYKDNEALLASHGMTNFKIYKQLLQHIEDDSIDRTRSIPKVLKMDNMHERMSAVIKVPTFSDFKQGDMPRLRPEFICSLAKMLGITGSGETFVFHSFIDSLQTIYMSQLAPMLFEEHIAFLQTLPKNRKRPWTEFFLNFLAIVFNGPNNNPNLDPESSGSSDENDFFQHLVKDKSYHETQPRKQRRKKKTKSNPSRNTCQSEEDEDEKEERIQKSKKKQREKELEEKLRHDFRMAEQNVLAEMANDASLDSIGRGSRLSMKDMTGVVNTRGAELFFNSKNVLR